MKTPFLVPRLFWPCDLDLKIWPLSRVTLPGELCCLMTTLVKTLTLEWYVLRLCISHECSIRLKEFTLRPWPWCLTYLLKNIAMALSFELYMLRLWYFTWMYLDQQIRQCDLELCVWPTYWKLLTLAISCEWYVLGLWYLTWVIETRPYRWYQQIWSCDLIMMFDLFIENFNLGCIF
jgi:hypothetical protein